MTGISLFAQDINAFEPDRANRLNARLHTEVGRRLDAVYALVWPDYQPPSSPVPQRNRAFWNEWKIRTGNIPLWAWFNASEDQSADAAALLRLTNELDPAGWLLDIEGEWTKGTKLTTLIAGAKATGKPIRASLAAATASHAEYDYRTLDANGIPVDWQAYMDSGEGSWPATAVAELFESSFTIGGWEYRHHWRPSGKYGWGKAGNVAGGYQNYDAYPVPGSPNCRFSVQPASWGWSPVTRQLVQQNRVVGQLYGRAKYANIRVTLDVTRGNDAKHSLEEWTVIAGSARVPGSAKRGVSVYTAEATSDDVLVAIAKGAP